MPNKRELQKQLDVVTLSRARLVRDLPVLIHSVIVGTCAYLNDNYAITQRETPDEVPTIELVKGALQQLSSEYEVDFKL